MRRVARPSPIALWPLALALLLSVAASLGLRGLGQLAQEIVLFILLTLAFFVAVNVLRAAAFTWRAGPWTPPFGGRWPWNRGRRPWTPPGGGSGRGEGWDLAGTREPRRPRPPLMPSRAEALDPDSIAPET
jgi:hypothetical protein